jgi:hypothetical protein
MTRSHGDAALGHKRVGLGSRGDAATRHERAVLHAEVTCLVNALSPFRVLRRDALARAAGATRWHEEMFDRALKAAVAQGQIKELPLRFYALPGAGAAKLPWRAVLQSSGRAPSQRDRSLRGPTLDRPRQPERQPFHRHGRFEHPVPRATLRPRRCLLR